MKPISVIQIGVCLVATINLTILFTDNNLPAVIGWFVVLLQCGTVICMAEGSKS